MQNAPEQQISVPDVWRDKRWTGIIRVPTHCRKVNVTNLLTWKYPGRACRFVANWAQIDRYVAIQAYSNHCCLCKLSPKRSRKHPGCWEGRIHGDRMWRWTHWINLHTASSHDLLAWKLSLWKWELAVTLPSLWLSFSVPRLRAE